MLSDFTVVAATIAETAKKSQKERVLADYLGGGDDAALQRAVVSFSGRPFRGESSGLPVSVGRRSRRPSWKPGGARARSFGPPWPRFAALGDTAAEPFRTDSLRAISLPIRSPRSTNCGGSMRGM
jgi:hypothetical protein